MAVTLQRAAELQAINSKIATFDVRKAPVFESLSFVIFQRIFEANLFKVKNQYTSLYQLCTAKNTQSEAM